MTDYNSIRQKLISNYSKIIELEKFYFNQLFDGLFNSANNIKSDFDKAIDLKDFWVRYAPKQRGHKPRGTSLPWGEVGEKVLDAYLYKIISSQFQQLNFIGLPYGHDIRFLSDNAFIHLDIKSTGPNDNPNEVVASPNQVSGDGFKLDNNGIENSKVLVSGLRKTMEFQPELPPFYIIDNKVYPTLTFYLKCVYKVVSPGNQPLDYLELICVPNGLLMFDTLNLGQTKGLLTPGKDIKTSKHKRTRIKLNPLSKIDGWRCQKLLFDDTNNKILTINR